MLKTKCKKCPYHLGLIKTIVCPCLTCGTNEMPIAIKKMPEITKICPKCGSISALGRCPKCRTKVTK